MTNQAETKLPAITHSAQAVVNCYITYAKINHTMSAFRLEYACSLSSDGPWYGMEEAFPSRVTYGCARTKDIQEFLGGQIKTIPQLGLQLVPDVFLKDASRFGYTIATSRHHGDLVNTSGLIDKYLSGETLGVSFVNVDHSSHLIFDMHGNILPVAIYFDYTSGRMCDEAYDLTKALEVLRIDPRITAVPVDSRGHTTKFDPYSESVPLSIAPVPYYNVREGCTESLSFYYSPTLEEMKNIWAHAKRINTRYPSTVLQRAVFCLDLLRLRESGAAKSDDFYGP